MEPAGIVIGAARDRSGWLAGLLATVDTDYPVVIDWTWEFELHSIALGARSFQEFVFLPYSTEVLDNGLWGLVFDRYQGTAVSLSQTPGPFGMYMGKYLADDVGRLGCPTVPSKEAAVELEVDWCRGYAELHRYVTLGDLPHSGIFVERHGRLNMVVENAWLRRFKGSWDVDSVDREVARLATSSPISP